MGILTWLSKKISSGLVSTTPAVATSSELTSTLVDKIIRLSNFDDMTDWEIYENLYQWDPEIGGAIDSLSTLVVQCYKGFYIEAGKELDEEEKMALRLANELAKKLKVEQLFEKFTELMLMHGNVFLDRENLVLYPAHIVTLVESRNQIGELSIGSDVITDPKFLVVNEGEDDEYVKIIPYHRILHLKFKDTPIFVEDRLGRLTYGVYSVSPLKRVVFGAWWKRIILIIDILQRWRTVPREHHVIDSSAFSLDMYTGSIEDRKSKARQDAKTVIDSYKNQLKTQRPDEGFVSLDTTEIKMIEPKSGYMVPNELLKQIQDEFWTGLNLPESIVAGKSRGSFASEYVVSGYVTNKVMVLARKIGGLIEEVVKEKIAKSGLVGVDTVEKVKIKLELVLEASKMELFRQAAIMKELGVFTDDEIRRHVLYGELTDEQRERIVRGQEHPGKVKGQKSLADIVRDVDIEKEPKHPETPWSEEDHLND